MKKSSAAKWVILSTAVTAVAAFAAGVAYELHAIKKLTVDIDKDEEAAVAPEATEEATAEETAKEATEEAVAEIIEEAAAEEAAEATEA